MISRNLEVFITLVKSNEVALQIQTLHPSCKKIPSAVGVVVLFLTFNTGNSQASQNDCCQSSRWDAEHQCQLSLADPLLEMARRGLRDTDPLFFQRTFPKLAGNVDPLGAVGVPGISGSLVIPCPWGNVAHPPCQSLSAL